MNEKQDWAAWGVAAVAAALVWSLWRRVERQRAERPPRAVGALSLNRASLEDLQTLPGVGAVMAERIVAGRPFKSVDDLRKVEGIGEMRLEALASLVRP